MFLKSLDFPLPHPQPLSSSTFLRIFKKCLPQSEHSVNICNKTPKWKISNPKREERESSLGDTHLCDLHLVDTKPVSYRTCQEPTWLQVAEN